MQPDDDIHIMPKVILLNLKWYEVPPNTESMTSVDKLLRVLIVEDRENDALLVLRELRQGGYDPQFERVETAATMRAALDRQTWDIVLSGYSLPHFSAHEALAVLKDRDLDLPFMIIPGIIGDETAVASLNAGAHDFIMKGSTAGLIPVVERELHDAEVRRKRREAEETARWRPERLQNFHGIDPSTLAGQLSESVAGLVLDFIRKQTNASRAGITLLNLETQEALELAAYSVHKSQLPGGALFSFAGLPAATIARLRAGDVLEVKDLSLLRHTCPIIPMLEAEGLRSAVMIPLRAQGQLIGTLNLGGDTPNAFSYEQIEVVHETANPLAIAIQQTCYLELLERHVTELEQHMLEHLAELQWTKDHTEAILNSSADGIVLASFDGVIQQVNPAVGNLFGCMIDDLIGQSLFMFIAPESVDALFAALHTVVNGKQPSRVQVTCRRKDGDSFDGELALSPIVDGSTISGIVGSLRDVTERQQIKDALRATFEQAAVGISLVSLDGRWLRVNQKLCDIVGYSGDELLALSFQDVTYPDDLDADLAYVRQALEGKIQTYSMDKRYVRKDQSLVWVNLTVSLVHDDSGEPKYFIGVIDDITVRKQLEENLRAALAQERELSELRTRFISMVSHDFRTPLSVIRSSADMLQTYFDRMDDERKANHFDKIRNQIDRMVALLNDVLSVSRADAGKMPFSPSLLDLDCFCRDLADEFQSAPDMKHALVYTSSGVPVVMPVDEKLVQQALINLLTNAFKYSPEGSSVYVELSFDADNAVIRVKDSGIGIPEADQPRLFEPFHRAGNVGEIPGTGLGLAIVKRSVEAHGGTVAFESQVGVGTTFTIRLPRIIRGESGRDENLGD